MEYLESFPPGSHRRKKFLEELNPGRRGTLLFLPVLERHSISAQAIPATGIGAYLHRSGWPSPIKSLLNIALNPTPELSISELMQGLHLATCLPAIDRWIGLLRVCQCAVVFHEMKFETNSKLQILLGKINSIEANRLLQKISSSKVVLPIKHSTSIVEEQLRLLVTNQTTSTSQLPQLIRNSMEGLMSPYSPDAAKQLAVLDRQAAVNSGSRIGSILSCLVGQVGSFTARRASHAVTWFRMVIHPSLDQDIPDGNLGKLFRLRSASDQDFDKLRTMMRLADEERHEDVLAIKTPQTPEVLSMWIDASISLKRSDDATYWAAELIATMPWMVRRLPLRELVNLMPTDVSTSTKQAVARTVVCNAALRHGISAEEERNDFFEDVLEPLPLRRPSEATSILLSSVSLPIAIHFLSIICSPEVMDTVPVGRSSAELLEERIRVLGYLRRIHPEGGGGLRTRD